MKKSTKKLLLSFYLLTTTIFAVYRVYTIYEKSGYVDEAIIVGYAVSAILMILSYFLSNNKNN